MNPPIPRAITAGDTFAAPRHPSARGARGSSMPFCKPAIPELARTWDAPTPPKNGGTTYAYAFLALTFTDITSPPAVDVANHFGTGYPKTYMDGATGGCGGFTMDAYEAPLGITQKSGGVFWYGVSACTIWRFAPGSVRSAKRS